MKKLLRMPSFSFSLRFSLQNKLIASFLIISALFLVLSITARNALQSSETAVGSVLNVTQLVRLAKEGNINLAKAGQIPKVIETAFGDLSPIQGEINQLRDKFTNISSEITKIASGDAREQELVNNYLQLGNSFYEALEGFVPTRNQMLVYTTMYKGQNRPLPDVLTERELGHIKFIRSLGVSIGKKKRLTGGMDYNKCGFYQWYTANPSPDEDIAEVFEEIDPLHRKLHNYAAEIDKLLRKDDYPGAEKILVSANKDLNMLGLYFSGLRNLALEKFEEVQDQFNDQIKNLDIIYDDSIRAASELESYLQDNVMQASLDDMEITSNDNRMKTMVYSGIGLATAVLIGIYATFVIRRAVSAVQRVVRELSDSAQDFSSMSERMSENSHTTMDMATSASDSMERTASSIDSVASAVQEMNASIQEISNSSISSAEMAGESVEEAKKTTELGMELQKLSEAIGTVSGTIRSIAFKINLLSLNANVEAARAGEAGAGFAVVAGEVKALAEATAEATDEITVKIESIQKGSKISADAIAKITDTISRMSENTSSIAAAVEEQSAITTDISSNVNMVVQATNQITGDIHRVSDAAGDTNERSDAIQMGTARLNDFANELNRLMQQF